MNLWSKTCLIALRIAIGWHFLYEGIYKYDTDTGTAPVLTSHSALQAATGRLRDYFLCTESGKFDVNTAFSKAEAWNDEIVRAFAAQKQLAEDQKARLAELRDRVKLRALAAARGEIEPAEIVNFDWTYVHAETLKIPPPLESSRFSAAEYLRNSAGPARGLFRSFMNDIDGLERLSPAGARALIDKRFEEILSHYEDSGLPFTRDQRARLAADRDSLKAQIAETLESPAFVARLKDYRGLRDRVRRDAGKANTPFARERLDADCKALDAIASEMLAFVNEPVAELGVRTQAIATVQQLGAGPVPIADLWVDKAVKFSLSAIGLSLMLGLFTPYAALAAAAQLAMFYIASPPWPGYPAAATGGHYLFIDRNLIELIAALTIAAAAVRRRTPEGTSHDSQ